ncbi:hypothetical protein [Noviherbaspirillum pedocola]|uniref:Uncharacterized protein n=1 Tax=Noviherbaspirillum pedocola TaxID=2801341 RepID=A0A934SW83_9BURK|nr:hypothetical protein [Noviherbaspirillum pedocola]MBK4736548.1 hypothetical protein [Noviherbaspirillum pedocola]
MTQHPRYGMPDIGDFAQTEARPFALRRIAVLAPDDAPGLAALRERLGDWTSLYAEHHAAGFTLPHSEALPAVFDRILERHARQPYDAVLLLDGRADALGIAESMRMIPEQIRRMPIPVWSAIAEDDGNTEIGDVAARTFASPAALFKALQRWLDSAAEPPVSTPVQWLPVPVAAGAGMEATAAPRARTHPLVLCAAGAVILASMTAIAAMLGVLPDLRGAPVAPPATVPAPAAQAYAAPTPKLLPSADMAVAASPTSSRPAPGVGSEPAPAARAADRAATVVTSSSPASTVSGSGTAAAEPAVLSTPASQPPAAAPVLAPQAEPAAPEALPASPAERERPKAAAAGPPRTAKHIARRKAKQEHATLAQAQAPHSRSPGSDEIPEIRFTGTKTRAQVVAELLASRRADTAQANPDIPAPPHTRARFKR